jgi:hypothetical protein
MEQRTSLYTLIERQLGSDLAEFVTSRRPDRSWRSIAAELSAAIDLEVSHESLRLWFSDVHAAAS